MIGNCCLKITSLALMMLSVLMSVLIGINLVYAFEIETLTPEQINELEKDPKQIIVGCNNRVNLKFDAGKLCDAFSSYLQKKCEKLDYLPEYCTMLANYLPKRVAQNVCILNYPLPNDTKGIKNCLNYLVFNSTYTNLPLNFTVKHVGVDWGIRYALSVINPNAAPVKFMDIYYDVMNEGKKLVSDIIPYSYILEPVSTRDIGTFIESKWDGVNGTYRYVNASTGVTTTKHFNFTANSQESSKAARIIPSIDNSTLGYNTLTEAIMNPKSFTPEQQAAIDMKCESLKNKYSLSSMNGTGWFVANCRQK